MPNSETLSHTKWDCKSHVVCIPKSRRQALYKELRQHLGAVFRSLAAQQECRVEAGHLLPDQVHMLLSIPPNTRSPKSWASSRGRVPSTWLGRSWAAARTLRGTISGHGGTPSRPSAGMRRPSGSPSARKKRRIDDWTTWACGKVCRLQAANELTALSGS